MNRSYRRVNLSALLPALSLALGVAACAETTGPEEPTPEGPDPELPAVSPEINAYYENADVERWQGIFERPGREVFDRRFEIVQAIGIHPGMTVADVGAGTGFYTMLFARAVGDYGTVYAVDISEAFVADIERRAAEYRVSNVVTIVNDQKDTHLPADSVDLVFLCDTYHHLEYPNSMLGSIARALKEDGELVLIDFRRELGFSSPWVMSHVRANKEQVTTEVLEAGFELVEELDLLRENYVLRFRKAQSPDGSG
jgi:SAM-dependent methyltransferase